MGIINIAPRETPRDPSLQAYFKLISSYPLLTTDEEVELFEKMKSASTESEKLQYREQIINSNLRFVISVAKQYSSSKIPFMDLVQQWNMWLCKAVDRYDPTRWFKFISYAVWWIRQGISQYIMSNKYLLKVPFNRQNIRSKVEKIISEFMHNNWYEPTSEQIFDLYVKKYFSNDGEVSEKDLKVVKSTIDDYTSLLNLGTSFHLDSTITDDTSSEFYELIEDENTPRTDDSAIQESLKNTLNDIIETLSYEQKYIIKSYFSENPESVSRIAEVLDISVSRVNTQKEKALKKIKYALLHTPDFADARDYKSELEPIVDKNVKSKKPKKEKEKSEDIWNTKKKATRKKNVTSSKNKAENLDDMIKGGENIDKKEDLWTVNENKPLVTSDSQPLADSESKSWFAEFFRNFAKAFWLK